MCGAVWSISEFIMPNWFVAFPVSGVSWFSRLPPPPVGTRVLAAADLHLTVAFLGDVGEARARAAFHGLAPAAIQSFEILMGPVVPMGNPRRPSALSALVERAGTEGRSVAEILTAPRDAILEAAALPIENRAMKPHVTLARLRRRAGADERQRALTWAAACDLASTRIELDRIGLYTAARDRTERAYDIVESRDLANLKS
jgi:2'-5' RNA ligase